MVKNVLKEVRYSLTVSNVPTLEFQIELWFQIKVYVFEICKVKKRNLVKILYIVYLVKKL